MGALLRTCHVSFDSKLAWTACSVVRCAGLRSRALYFSGCAAVWELSRFRNGVFHRLSNCVLCLVLGAWCFVHERGTSSNTQLRKRTKNKVQSTKHKDQVPSTKIYERVTESACP